MARCELCQRQGRKPDTSGAVWCPSCGVTYTAAARELRSNPCPSCKGTGRVNPGGQPGTRSSWPLDDPICDRCQGSGLNGPSASGSNAGRTGKRAGTE